jgi:alanine racemase
MDAKKSLGEPRVLISRSALLHNLGVIRRQLDPAVRVCAMVKADAYGHGADLVADTLANFLPDNADPSYRPADLFAVATIEEAAALPECGKPVWILRPIENVFAGRQKEQVELAVMRGWTLTLMTTSAAGDVARVATMLGRRASVQIMVDTGLTRCGVSVDYLDSLFDRVRTLPALKLVGLGTHFATSDVHGDLFTQEQRQRFVGATDDLLHEAPGLLRHAANSGAIFLHRRAHFDVVRPGISLYGIDPTGRPAIDRPLRPVLKWLAPILAIHGVARGTTVGYDRTWTAPRESRVGLVPVGYADGYPRALSNKAHVLLGEHLCPVVGRVSMDLITIDLTDVPHAAIGDDVTLLDNDPISPVSAYKLAEWSGTSPYEVFTRIGQRIRRVAVDPDDAPVAEEIDDGTADLDDVGA